jgi:hypothetical protein
MSSERRRSLGMVALASLFVLAQTAVPTAADSSVGAGVIKGFHGVQVTGLPDYTCTSAEEFEDMAGMALGLRARGPIVVMFQAQFGGFETTPDARGVVRIVVDDEVVGSAVAIANDVGSAMVTFGFNAFSKPLGRGKHDVKVLWRSFPAGSTTCAEERSLIVLHP